MIRRVACLRAAGLALTFAVVVYLAPRARAQGGFEGPGIYEITNVKSGKVMDLDRNDQTTVIQFSARGTDNQAWSVRPTRNGYFYLRNMMNGYALEARGNENSTPVVGRPFDGGPNQQWRFEPGKDGNVLITSRLGKTLDVPDGTSRDGARLQIYDANGDSNQRFTLRPVSRNGPALWDMAGGTTITCSSDDGGRRYCDADTRGGVQLLRQISGSPCELNRTWGYDARGIWVDRGCRAEFQSGGSGYPRGDVRTLTCSSNDEDERKHCPADTTGGVRLVRQISGSPCEINRTWGYDNRGIWVDKGCRAEFQIGR